jgi:hypothetical protein
MTHDPIHPKAKDKSLIDRTTRTRHPRARKQPAQQGVGKQKGRSSPPPRTTPLGVRPATIVPLDAEQENVARSILRQLYSEFLASRNQR